MASLQAFTLDTVNRVATTDGSRNDVAAAIASPAVTDGWTITIPAGTFTWASGVIISGKGIHVRGAGSGRIVGRSTSSVLVGPGTKSFTTQSGLQLSSGQTIRVIHTANGNNFMQGTVTSYSGTTLTVNVTTSGGTGTRGFWVIATNPLTIITNNAGTAISITEDTTHSVEVSGIKFVQGTSTSSHIGISAATGGRPALIHDCWMTANTSYKMILVASNHGVVWNCSFDSSFSSTFPSPSANTQAIGLKWEGGSSTWATPSTMGTADTGGAANFYIEDSDFHGLYLQSMDVDDNSRSVIRHNVFNNSAMVAHGQDTSPHGVRHYEIYDNVFLFNDVGSESYNLPSGYFYVRGGTGVISDNSFTDVRSSFWGDSPESSLTVQHIRRRAGIPVCWSAGPAAPRQVGYGYVTGAGNTGPGGYQGDLEPLYIWNNTGTFNVGRADYQPDECGNNQTVVNYIRPGVEYITGSAKPSYTKYTYPHPLRSSSANPPPGPPQNVRIVR